MLTFKYLGKFVQDQPSEYRLIEIRGQRYRPVLQNKERD